MKLIIFLGTRPEIIKLAPVIEEARRRGHEVDVVFSGQHTSLAEPLLRLFQIEPEVRLDVLKAGQSLLELSRRLLEKFETHLNDKKADYAVVQGDTTTALLGSYWAFLRNIPVAHVEAGLRTHDLTQPFPEEANRQLIGRLSALHFVPTIKAKFALLNEAVPSTRIFQVGNTGIDALERIRARLKENAISRDLGWSDDLREWCQASELILVTSHRRENHGGPLERIVEGLLRLLDARPNARALLPVHPNPHVAPILERNLAGHDRVRLSPPLDYVEFIQVMEEASLILTDSGGVQEEAPSFGKRLLVLREKTERQEGVAAGFAHLVGTDPEQILQEGLRILAAGPLNKPNPYGDGHASERILDVLEVHCRKNQILSVKKPSDGGEYQTKIGA